MTKKIDKPHRLERAVDWDNDFFSCPMCDKLDVEMYDQLETHILENHPIADVVHQVIKNNFVATERD